MKGGCERSCHLGKSNLEDVLGAPAKHARDARPQQLAVPRFLSVVAGRAQRRVEQAGRPVVPWGHAVDCPELIHLVAPRVPLDSDLADEQVFHLRGHGKMNGTCVRRDLLEVHPRRLAVPALTQLPCDVRPALRERCVWECACKPIPVGFAVVRDPCTWLEALAKLLDAHNVEGIHKHVS